MKTRVESIQRDVQLIIQQDLSPAARAKQFAADAKVFLDEADETNRQVLGRVPRNQTWVNGREGASLESAGAGGVIVREYDLVMEVLAFIGNELRVASPIGKGPDKRPGHPGFYRASHTLFADGTEVPVGSAVPDAKEYVFLSTAPYSRRIERRYDVYEMTAAKAARRFGNIAKVVFGWQSPLLSYVQGARHRLERQALRKQPARQSAMRIERATRVPAITVRTD